jgi:hypothetical protein
MQVSINAKHLVDSISPLLDGYSSLEVGEAFGLILYSIGFEHGQRSAQEEEQRQYVLEFPKSVGEAN